MIVHRSLVTSGVSLVLALMGGCGDSPADVAGDYSVAVTNGPNGCELDNWDPGASTANIPIEIAQNDEAFTATVTGLTGTYLTALFATNQFVGTISGTHLDGEIRGNAGGEGSCAYTPAISLDAEIDGDVITGTLRYYFDTNGDPECGALDGCANTQDFNGTRPPTR